MGARSRIKEAAASGLRTHHRELNPFSISTWEAPSQVLMLRNLRKNVRPLKRTLTKNRGMGQVVRIPEPRVSDFVA